MTTVVNHIDRSCESRILGWKVLIGFLLVNLDTKHMNKKYTFTFFGSKSPP